MRKACYIPPQGQAAPAGGVKNAPRGGGLPHPGRVPEGAAEKKAGRAPQGARAKSGKRERPHPRPGVPKGQSGEDAPQPQRPPPGRGKGGTRA